jgi:hypothetical protein
MNAKTTKAARTMTSTTAIKTGPIGNFILTFGGWAPACAGSSVGVGATLGEAIEGCVTVGAGVTSAVLGVGSTGADGEGEVGGPLISLKGVELTSVPALGVGATVSLDRSADAADALSSVGAASATVDVDVSLGVITVGPPLSGDSSTSEGVVNESTARSDVESPAGGVEVSESELLKSGVSVTLGASSVGEGSGVGSADGGVSEGVLSDGVSELAEVLDAAVGPGSSDGGRAGFSSSVVVSSLPSDGVVSAELSELAVVSDELEESVDTLSSLTLSEVTSTGSVDESTLGLDEITDLSS